MSFLKNGPFELKIGTDTNLGMGIPNNDFVLNIDTFLVHN